MKILSAGECASLSWYVEEKLDNSPNGCDGSLTYVYEWLEENDMAEIYDIVRDELFSCGITCDCELLYRGI